jgi:hypothetical protein
MANIIKPDFKNIPYYKRTQHKWIAENFDRLGLGQVKNVGSLIDFCYKKKPTDLEDFWWKWIKLTSNQKRFIMLLNTISKIRPNKSEDENINTLFIGLFYNTLLGYLAEIKVGQMFTHEGYKVYKSKKSFDKKYAIDFLVISPNKQTTGIQVKSEGSRYNNATQYIQRNQRKMAKFRSEYRVNTAYAYYTYSYDMDNKTFDILGFTLDV